MQDSVAKAINKIITYKDDFMDVLMKNIVAVIGDDFDGNIANIEKQLKELQDELIGKANLSEDYDTTVNEIYRLRELKQKTLEHNAEQQAKRQRITEMEDFLQERRDEIIEYEDKLVRQLVESVVVNRDKLTVTFKSGLEVEV